MQEEIVLKEKYGSSPNEIQYSVLQNGANLTIRQKFAITDVFDWLKRIFLPQGYPDSVSSDYLAYQKWDTAQAFCSTITGILATQEVLRGVGVGDTNATPLAATVTWVLKDGCGHVGRILFAFSHGTQLDAYSKKWRLYADTLNDAAMCIEIALPLFKNYTTFALCISTIMKSIVGVAGGATRAAMTQHHAIRGNLADVSAKDSAQETAVNLVASFTALLIIFFLGNTIFIFVMLMILHIACNYLAVRAICLRTLNEPRFLQVIDMYLRDEVIGSPCEINRKEPIIFYQLGPNLLDLKKCGFQIKLGHSIKAVIKLKPSSHHLYNIMEIYNLRNYLIYPQIHQMKMFVLFRENASTDDIMCAYFHAVVLSILTCATNGSNLSLYSHGSSRPRPFASVCQAVQAAAWSREPTDHTGFSHSKFEYEPSYELMKYVDKIVVKEWYRIRIGLNHTGWTLNRHLLMVDEWRVRSHKFTEKNVLTYSSQTEGSVKSCHELMLDDIFEKVTEEIIDKDPYTIEPDFTVTKQESAACSADLITLKVIEKKEEEIKTEMESKKNK